MAVSCGNMGLLVEVSGVVDGSIYQASAFSFGFGAWMISYQLILIPSALMLLLLHLDLF